MLWVVSVNADEDPRQWCWHLGDVSGYAELSGLHELGDEAVIGATVRAIALCDDDPDAWAVAARVGVGAPAVVCADCLTALLNGKE